MKSLDRIRNQIGVKRLVIMSVVLAAVTVFMRVWQLQQVPPGLHVIEATNGLAALSGKLVPSLSEIQHLLSNLLIWIGQKLSSNRVLGVRLGPVLAGIASVFFFYRWLVNTYGRRVAQIGSLFLATLPWPLYLTRFGSGYALALLFMSASLYLSTSSWQRRGSRRAVVTIVVLALGFYTHPSYNWFAVGILLAALANLRGLAKLRRNFTARASIGSLTYLLVAAPAAPAILRYFADSLNDLGGIGGRAVAVLQTFNLRSPINYDFGLANLPLLNAFAGIMMILGLLIILINQRRAVNRALLVLLVIGLLPYIVMPSGTPLADRIITLILPAIALAAIGANYLLEQWLSTFPQNSAARQVGSFMLVVLMLMSARHSYNQYFLAWRASSLTKDAYSRSAVEASGMITAEPFKGERYLIGSDEDLVVAEYLTKGRSQIRLLKAGEIKNITKDKNPKQFILLPDAKDDAILALAKQFPGGKLQPELTRSKQELFLIYTLKP